MSVAHNQVFSRMILYIAMLKCLNNRHDLEELDGKGSSRLRCMGTEGIGEFSWTIWEIWARIILHVGRAGVAVRDSWRLSCTWMVSASRKGRYKSCADDGLTTQQLVAEAQPTANDGSPGREAVHDDSIRGRQGPAHVVELCQAQGERGVLTSPHKRVAP